MDIKSPAFENGAPIPARFTCDGENLIPPLVFSGMPDDTESLALIMEDVDSVAGVWHHWVIWNIPAKTKEIKEGVSPKDAQVGKNSFGTKHYGGPCPKEGEHRYCFYLYALDKVLSIPDGLSKEELETEMVGHVLEKAEMFGTYERAM